MIPDRLSDHNSIILQYLEMKQTHSEKMMKQNRFGRIKKNGIEEALNILQVR